MLHMLILGMGYSASRLAARGATTTKTSFSDTIITTHSTSNKRIC